MGDHLTIGGCALLPCLGCLRQVYPYDAYGNIQACFAWACERPFYARVMDEAQPYLPRMMQR